MINIAIDGPAGAGKSTIAKMLAKKMNITYLDTGAMYRAVALKSILLGVDVEDEEGVKAFLPIVDLDIRYIDGVQHVYLDGNDVSKEIREHRMSKAASDISRIPAVRLKLVEMQRALAAKYDCVLDGRDITSYVLPDAKYKFFITASPEVRAERRKKELEEKGESVDFAVLLEDIKKRDYNDSHRPFAPLVCTEDSVLIDTSDMTIDEVIAKVLAVIEEKK
ncbi:MAG: (d)CMP kinase [Clostridia bacterium]|nr:(d)CMP kinase [Clostridia bacterium]